MTYLPKGKENVANSVTNGQGINDFRTRIVERKCFPISSASWWATWEGTRFTVVELLVALISFKSFAKISSRWNLIKTRNKSLFFFFFS